MAVDLDAEKFPIENLSDIEYWGDIVHLLMYDKKKFEDIASKALAVIRNSIHDFFQNLKKKAFFSPLFIFFFQMNNNYYL